MNVSELYDLTYWIRNEIEEREISQKYQNLFRILQRNTQPNNPRVPFEDEKNELIDTLKEVPLIQLTKAQLIFLENLGLLNVVGQEGVEQIEDTLYKNALDIATSSKKINEMHQSLNDGLEKANQIRTGLSNCVSAEDYEEENEILMRVSFIGEASMNNVVDLKKWGIIWHDIGRGVAMAHDVSPEEIRVVGATRGSIIIELSTIAAIAGTVSGIILSALTVAEKVVDIRMKVEELRGYKLKNDKVVKDLAKEADNEKKLGIEEITNIHIKKLKINTESEGDKVKALDTAVKNLVNFIENGGEVDFIAPDDSEDAEEENIKRNDELRMTFQEIKRLENKIAMLERKD